MNEMTLLFRAAHDVTDWYNFKLRSYNQPFKKRDRGLSTKINRKSQRKHACKKLPRAVKPLKITK